MRGKRIADVCYDISAAISLINNTETAVFNNYMGHLLTERGIHRPDDDRDLHWRQNAHAETHLNRLT